MDVLPESPKETSEASEEETSEEESEFEAMMVWDDDEQYVPPVIINENFLNQDRPPIFGEERDGYNSLVFSTEELKQ